MNIEKTLHGKVSLITGATSGIGLASATALATLGATVIIVGRDPAKLCEAVLQIKAKTGNHAVHSQQADFTDLGQVRKLSVRFKREYERLDVLVNNAGAFFNTRRPTPYKVEMTFLVNHLAPFLLTNLLLGRLMSSAPARIVNVSSDAHKYGKIDFNDLNFKRFYFGMLAYARSKLANILFTYELARRLDGKGVTTNALHPGHVATAIWRKGFPVIGPALKLFMGQLALTPEQGADNSVFLAASPNVKGVTGKYFVGREAVPSSALSYDRELSERLWEFSEWDTF